MNGQYIRWPFTKSGLLGKRDQKPTYTKFGKNWIFLSIFLPPYWIRHLDFWKSESWFVFNNLENPRIPIFIEIRWIFNYPSAILDSVYWISYDNKNGFVISDSKKPYSAIKWNEKVIKCIIWCSKNSKIDIQIGDQYIFDFLVLVILWWYFILKFLIIIKIILLINFIFDPTFFLIASYQILKNYVILINHESFFQRKDFPQLHRFWFLKINSLMTETIKKNIFQNEIFIKKLLNLIIICWFSKIGNG